MVLSLKIVCLLMWKCVLLRRRNWLLTLLDLAAPIGVIFLCYNTLNDVIHAQLDEGQKYVGVVVSNPPQDILNPTISALLEVNYCPFNFDTVFVMTKYLLLAGQRTTPLGRKNESDLELWLYDSSKTGTITFAPPVGIVFLEYNKKNSVFKYKIRHSDFNIDTAEIDIQKYAGLDPYEASGFLRTQLCIDIALMDTIGYKFSKNQAFIGAFPVFMPIDLNLSFLVMHIVMTFAYVFLVIAIVRDVLQEKSSGIKELMKIMGVSGWMIWVQWVIYTLVVHLPVTLIAAYFLAWYKSPVIPANIVVVWLLLFLFTMNCIFFLFILTCLFNGAVIGTIISVSVWFIVHIWSEFNMDPNDFGFAGQILFCLVPLNNLIWVFTVITSFYDRGVTWTLKQLFATGSTGSYISVALSITISILETIILIFILIFLDAIKPGKYGVGKPITFICQWCRSLIRHSEEPDYIISSLPSTYESPPKESKVGIEIRGLHKRCGLLNKVVAVEKVDLDIYEGEIMALLGHNGAGKTTTMSMITGMFSPTKGVIRFNGKDISKNSSYRDSLGICTQHNLYFSKLTVIEHLIFFGMLRGMSRKEAKLAGGELLNTLNMSKKTNSFGADLSGGMKRRLCLAVSLVGNPKYLILDEPTSGLDPQTRRKIWNIILSMRGQRTILITTHFMEEADVLSDRIAIMDHGIIVCCGTTMFLKRLYGTGYNLHILKAADASPDNILYKIRQYVANPRMKLSSPTQTDFIIKDESVKELPDMFAALEGMKSSLGITGISVTCTTMEDVFLKVAEKSIEGETVNSNNKVTRKPSTISKRTNDWVHIEGFDLWCVRYKILLWKIMRYQCKQIIWTLIKVIITSIMVWYVVHISIPKKVLRTKQPPLTLNLGIFKNYFCVVVYDDVTKPSADIAIEILEQNNWKVTVLPYPTNMTTYITNLFVDDYATYSETLLALQFIDTTITIQYQNYLHLSAVAGNLITNVLLRNAKGVKSNIEIINHPYVPETEECVSSILVQTSPFILTFVFSFSLILLMMDIIPLLTEERVSGFKHQQTLAGVTPILYWMANFTYHYCFYLSIVIIYVIIIVVEGGKVIVESRVIDLLVLVLLLYGISGIFIVYLFTFFIDRIVTSLSIFMMVNIFLGIVPVIILYVKRNILYTILFCINPLFAVSMAIANIAFVINQENACKICNIPVSCLISERSVFVMADDKTPFGILLYVLFLGLSWLLYFGIILIFDYGCIRKILLILFYSRTKCITSEEDDNDVKKEYDVVRLLKERNDQNTPLRVDGLSKKYFCGPRAVYNVSFVVVPGECFGLLGVNGAGKSTTFQILTGEIFPNGGDAVILGQSLMSSRRKYQSCIGYCPQYDAFVDSFTGQEIITIIGRVRGIPRKNLKREVDEWVETMGISSHVKKRSGTYSGGTKRKLSTAMAFIGNPVVVFLDEPTTGVDPESRRKLWTVMESRQKAGQAIVLTSHSMEECEALCTRLTIMRDGQMKCIGSSEYLKQKFSQGYTVLLKLENSTDVEFAELKKVFGDIFPTSVIVDEHMSLINYQILDSNVPLSRLFSIMLQLKSKHDIIEDFSISNTSMEQLFMSFVMEKKGSK